MSNSQQTNNQEPFIETGSSPKDYTHKSPEVIRRELGLGNLGRFLLWLAKADLYVLLISTYESRGRLMSLGAMVIFTALLAFFTSFYTLTTTLIGPETPFRYLIGFLLAGTYTFGIIIIDREIVGATSKSFFSTFIRLTFAIFIATAVSYPAKLKFFEGRIDQEINQIITEKNIDSYERIKELKERAEQEKSIKIQNFQARIESATKEIAMYDKQIREEQGRTTCGPICLNFIAQKKVKDSALKNILKERETVSTSDTLSQVEQAEINTLEEKIENQRNRAYDILFKHEALTRITSTDQNANMISWFLLIFFLLLELVPLALKWSMGFSEYHYYIEARNRINKQKIVSITNLYMHEMQQDDKNVFTVPLELTDLIALMLEDESRHIKEPEELLRSLHAIKEEYSDNKKTGINTANAPVHTPRDPETT